MRRALWLLRAGNSFGLSEEVRHDSAQLLDRLLRRGMSALDARSPLVLSSIALLAARQGVSLGFQLLYFHPSPSLESLAESGIMACLPFAL